MAALARLDNPVLWQEFTHQERTAPRWMRRSSLLGIAAIVLILVGVPLTLQNDNAYPTMQLALFVTWLVHAAVALRAIVAGANAISREHVGQTWDALTLTGLTDRQILLGKWRAALWRVRGWMVALGVVRLGMLPVFMVGLVKTFAWYMCGQYTYTQYGASYYCSTVEMSWVPWAAVLAVVMTVALTLLDVLCCTALGLAASALTRRGSTAAMVAILVRFTPVLLFGAFTRYEIGTFSYRWWGYTPFALADGGTSPIMRLALPLIPWTRNQHLEAVPGLALSLLMISVFLLVAVIAAWAAIRRTGALPHSSYARKARPAKAPG